MAIFDKIGSIAKNVTEKVSEKATDAIELTKLNSKISDVNKLQTKNLEKIGSIIFKQYLDGDPLPEEIESICKSLKEGEARITELQEAIKELKDLNPKETN